MLYPHPCTWKEWDRKDRVLFDRVRRIWWGFRFMVGFSWKMRSIAFLTSSLCIILKDMKQDPIVFGFADAICRFRLASTEITLFSCLFLQCSMTIVIWVFRSFCRGLNLKGCVLVFLIGFWISWSLFSMIRANWRLALLSIVTKPQHYQMSS